MKPRRRGRNTETSAPTHLLDLYINYVMSCDRRLRSKSARKKKREEAQKLPEVSKEIYYDVTGDLKAMFGLEKDDKDDKVEEEGKLNWDQEEEEDGGEKDEEQPPPTPPLFSDPSAEGEESSGFKFSFFGNDAEAESEETGQSDHRSIPQNTTEGVFFILNLSVSSCQRSTRWRASRLQKCHGNKTHVYKTAAQGRMRKSRRKMRRKPAPTLKQSERNQSVCDVLSAHR